MNKTLLILLFWSFTFSVSAQGNFEMGYFIDNEGKRTDCLIRNYDRKVNPFQIEYKLTTDGAVEIGGLSQIKEFEIFNTIHKYQRFTVNIDRSSNDVDNLSSSREPDFKEETLFLRVLVEGRATLYTYFERGGLNRNFFKMDDSEVEQLVYKRYSNAGQLGENESYKHQLRYYLTCASISGNDFDDLYYQQKHLVSLFNKFNECSGGNYIDYTSRKKKGNFGLAVTGGANISALETTQKVHTTGGKIYKSYTHDMTVSPLVSLEAEYNFTFNNGKWYAFIEPTFQQFKYKSDFSYTMRLQGGYEFISKGTLSVNYDHIAIPLGIKYAAISTENSSVTIHAAGVFNFLLNNSNTYDGTLGFNMGQGLDFRKEKHFQIPSAILGVGYKYKKFSLEADYHLNKTAVAADYWEIKFVNSVSLMLGYSLF
jgi:hypothetical protein